jgi:NAD(P)-dependent dehydrogenase (short-subunit alcohol dehydrogenase family)
MSKNIAMEYAKEQIRANTVAPGVERRKVSAECPAQSRLGISRSQRSCGPGTKSIGSPAIFARALYIYSPRACCRQQANHRPAGWADDRRRQFPQT